MARLSKIESDISSPDIWIRRCHICGGKMQLTYTTGNHVCHIWCWILTQIIYGRLLLLLFTRQYETNKY